MYTNVHCDAIFATFVHVCNSFMSILYIRATRWVIIFATFQLTSVNVTLHWNANVFIFNTTKILRVF